MPYPYFTQKDLEDRLGEVRVRRIFDDSNIGLASEDAITRLRKDASSKVRGRLGSHLKQGQIDDVEVTTPDEIVRIALDMATALAAQRYPEVVQYDWEPIMKEANADLDRWMKGQISVGVEATAAMGVATVLSDEPRGWDRL